MERGLAEGNWLHCQIASSHPDKHLGGISTGQQFLVAFVGWVWDAYIQP